MMTFPTLGENKKNVSNQQPANIVVLVWVIYVWEHDHHRYP
jgi:hypothetical protein